MTIMFRPLALNAGDGGNRSGLAALARGPCQGFRLDPRGWTTQVDLVEQGTLDEDPGSAEWRAGFAAGLAEGSKALRSTEQASVAVAAIELGIAKLDAAHSGQLANLLRDAVVALCGSVIDLSIIDPEALNRRIEAASALLQRADDNRRLRLNPEDLALVQSRLATDSTPLADPTLERGTVRIDTSTGGIEDGPAGWRRAIEAAVSGC